MTGQFSNIQTGNSQGLGDIKQQLLTLFLFKSTAAAGSGGSGDGGIYTMVWTFLIVGIMDKLFHYLPQMIETYQKRLDAYTKFKLKEIANQDMTNTDTPKKETSRITIKIDPQKQGNVVGDAILDYITNIPNIEKVVYLSKTYLLNNTAPILLDTVNELYVKLHNEIHIDEGAEETTYAQIISLYSYVLDIYQLRKFVDKITYEYTLKIQNKLGDDIYFFDAIQLTPFVDGQGNIDYLKMPNTLTFTMKKFVTNRKFKNVIGSQARLIQKRVEFFKNNKKWYDDKGIPYTLGLLLSGPPGGGKTSTIKCVANEMKRHIINVKLTDCITKTQMENLFFNETITVVVNGRNENFIIPLDKRLYVFEDVDCQNSDIVLDRETINNEISIEEIKEEGEDNEFTNVLLTGQNNQQPNQPQQSMLLSKVPHNDIFSAYEGIMGNNVYNSFSSTSTSVFTQYSHENTNQTANKNTNKMNNSKEMLKDMSKDIYYKTNNKTQPHKKADNPSLEKQHVSEKLSLSCLLNIFDGVLETPGRIIIMTSNYPKKLDRALIRPGRIDLICEFSKCDTTMTVELFESFYDIVLSEEEKKEILERNQNKYTPAELTKIMFENFNNYKEAIQSL
jgi:hypothetical protein